MNTNTEQSLLEDVLEAVYREQEKRGELNHLQDLDVDRDSLFAAATFTYEGKTYRLKVEEVL